MSSNDAARQQAISSRRRSMALLRKVHTEDRFLFNMVLIFRDHISKSFETPEERREISRQLFVLTISIGRITVLPAGVLCLRALAQLVIEYEHYVRSKTIPDVAGLFSRSGHTTFPNTLVASNSAPLKPSLHKFGGKCIYEHLLPLPLIFQDLDYCTVVASLLQGLEAIYAKFLDPGCASLTLSEGFVRMDEKLKALVLEPIAKRVRDTAKLKLSEAMLTPWPPKSALRRKLEFFEKSKGGNRRDSTQSEEKLPDEN